MVERVELLVYESERRKRLEDFLFDRFPGLSRMYLRGVVRSESCEVNGRTENIGFRLRPNDFVEIELEPGRENAMRPERIPLEIVYEDDDLVVVNKPAGMLVHPTNRDKSGTLLNALSHHLNGHTPMTKHETHTKLNGKGDNGRQVIRPGLVHRLDKQTSGLMVVAKNPHSHRALARQFQNKLVVKRYLALVLGALSADEGTIDLPISRDPDKKHWGVKEGGKSSETRYRVIRRLDNATFLELEPVTGRTNQLRIHCAALGHPIIGDTLRGGGRSERLFLHASRLAFRHSRAGTPLEFCAQPSWELGEQRPDARADPAQSDLILLMVPGTCPGGT